MAAIAMATKFEKIPFFKYQTRITKTIQGKSVYFMQQSTSVSKTCRSYIFYFSFTAKILKGQRSPEQKPGNFWYKTMNIFKTKPFFKILAPTNFR